VSAGRRFKAYGGNVTQTQPAAVKGKRGIDALRDPATNKSTAFTDAEREEACLDFGHIFRRPRGMYLSLKHKGRIEEVLRNWPVKDVRVICATSVARPMSS
jgi:hypothetical protein